ncbi:MAG TPA: Loki-CTERM sorting domain-containing protein, partial [Solirubrobacteraceae bacterium]
DAVRNRANYATIGLEVTGVARKHAAAPGGGSWTPGDAAHDAVRVLEVSAGVALIALAVLVPLTLVGAAGGFAAVALRRRRREAALSS